MFWIRICFGGREYLGVLDTGATISVVAKNILPRGDLENIMRTAAICMRNGHVVHSCGECEVYVPMGSMSIAIRSTLWTPKRLTSYLDRLLRQTLRDSIPHVASTLRLSKWTMVREGNLYHWSSLNTRQAT